jgi:hypothetical protein
LGCIVTPFVDPQGKVWFRVTGDLREPCGGFSAMRQCGQTALKNIKNLRHAIYTLRGKKRERTAAMSKDPAYPMYAQDFDMDTARGR